jgi:Tol biopolymer transport system component
MLSFCLCLICSLMMFAARVWGQVLSPTALLAFQVQYSQIDIRLYVIDVARGLTIPFGQIAGVYSWSHDGQLAFIDYDGNLQVWDGMNTAQIAQSVMGGLTWSNDGQLAFVAYRAEDGHEYLDVMIWDGSTSIIVGEQASFFSYDLAWSSDGRLAFVAPPFNGSQIVVWDGTQLTNVTEDLEGTHSSPAWSPDGRLAFVSQPDNTGEISNIYVWDGISLDLVAHNNTINKLPTWSSDGRLAFISLINNFEGGVSQWDGVQYLPLGFSVGSHPLIWSHDGRLAFTSLINQQQDVMVWDGRTIMNISLHPLQDSSQSWTNDGNLLFISERDGYPQIYIWDGSSVMRVELTPPYASYPQWWTP